MRFDVNAAVEAALAAIAGIFLLLTPAAYLLSGMLVKRMGTAGWNAAVQYPLWVLLALSVVAFVVAGFIGGIDKKS